MRPLEKLDDRFRNDPEFKNVVDVMTGIILNLQLSPSELREAATYACYRAEMMAPRPLKIEMGKDEYELIQYYKRMLGS